MLTTRQIRMRGLNPRTGPMLEGKTKQMKNRENKESFSETETMNTKKKRRKKKKRWLFLFI